MPELHLKEKRRSDRIAVAIPIQVRGTDVAGKRFEEATKTVEINQNGTHFELRTSLRPNQEIFIRNLRRDTESSFRVVGKVPGPNPSATYWGTESLEPTVDFWGIKFPPIKEAEQATARILLQCGQCKTQELSYLCYLETEVFSFSQRVHRHCQACGDWTEWENPEPGKEGEPPVAVPLPRGRESRVHRRLPLQMSAWIRTCEGEEEVVTTVNVSPGGIAVRSKKNYSKGSWLKIAFPYQPSAAITVVLGRVVRVSATEDPSVQLYGIQYLR